MDNQYMVCIKGKYKVTAKFMKEMTGLETGVLMLPSGPIVAERPLPAITPTTDWVGLYTKFILEAQVPSRGTGKDGGYDLNKYSEQAMKCFRRMVEKEGVKYPILVKSTMLYYKTRKTYPVTITKYITDGAWRSDYQALLSSAEDNTIQEHIQQEIDATTEFNRFKLG